MGVPLIPGCWTVGSGTTPQTLIFKTFPKSTSFHLALSADFYWPIFTLNFCCQSSIEALSRCNLSDLFYGAYFPRDDKDLGIFIPVWIGSPETAHFRDEDLVNGANQLNHDLSNSNSRDPVLEFWKEGSKRVDKGRDLQGGGGMMAVRDECYSSTSQNPAQLPTQDIWSKLGQIWPSF